MASNIPVIVQGNSFSLAIPLQIYYINGDQMDLEDYTPDPTDEVSVQLKGSRRNYTYTPTIDGNVANIDLTGNELADNYGVVVSVVKANGQRLRSFRTDQFFIVESSDDLTPADIIEGLEENVIYLNSSIFVAGEDGRGIVDIQKTSTQGLVDTYTIYYTDNTTSTFQVTNGADGGGGGTSYVHNYVAQNVAQGNTLVDKYIDYTSSTRGNINSFGYSNTYEIWCFPVVEGDMWRISNTHPSGVSSNSCEYALYSANNIADFAKSNAVLVSSDNLSDEFEVDITIPSGAKWLAVQRYLGGGLYPEDVVKVSKAELMTLDEAFDMLKEGMEINAEINKTTTATIVADKYIVNDSTSNNGDIGSYGTGVYDILFFPVVGGEIWHVVNTHPSGASLGAAAYAVYDSSATTIGDCDHTNDLLVASRVTTAIDTDISIPSGAKWLAVQRYNGGNGNAPDVVTVSKYETLTPAEAYTEIEGEIASSIKAMPLCVKRSGENVIVCYNDGNGTEIVYEFGRVFPNSNNTLGLAHVGYRKVTRKSPIADTGGTTELCNQITSDMFGPVQVGGNFFGGNHTYNDNPTASSVSWTITADGTTVADGANLFCREVTVVSVNKVQCLSSGSLADMMEETITMTVSENMVKCHVKHDYKYSGGVGQTITRYYGMQSMFGARATAYLLTPNGEHTTLVAENSSADLGFTKGDYPSFNRFIQKDPQGWCQSAWVNPAIGIGDHSEIGTSDDIFLDGGSNKMYHQLIRNKSITAGMVYQWGGIYKWSEDKGADIEGDLYKQEILVSGTNIKTLNNASLLGVGNITVAENVAVVEVSGATPTQELAPNTFYKFTGSVTSLTVTLGTAVNGIANIYAFSFYAATANPTITLPQGVQVADTPTIGQSDYVEFSIMDNKAIAKVWSAS